MRPAAIFCVFTVLFEPESSLLEWQFYPWMIAMSVPRVDLSYASQEWRYKAIHLDTVVIFTTIKTET